MAASESIVSNILITKETKKKKKKNSFSQKHVAQDSNFLSENLKAKAKLKNMKSQECYEKFPGKRVYLHLFFHLLFLFFIYLIIYFISNQKSPTTP